jgi:hypothetical protein
MRSGTFGGRSSGQTEVKGQTKAIATGWRASMSQKQKSNYWGERTVAFAEQDRY